jgi:hypothetical protein
MVGDVISACEFCKCLTRRRDLETQSLSLATAGPTPRAAPHLPGGQDFRNVARA